MATYMGLAWVDLAPGADLPMALLRDGAPRDAPAELSARVVDRSRIELASDSVGYGSLGDLVVDVMGRTAAVSRAFVALDHDEYGAEHVVLDLRDNQVRRVHHVFVYPRRWGGRLYRAGEPALTHVPAAVPGGRPRRGRLVDGPRAWAAVAALYDKPVERVAEAAAAARTAHRELGIVGAPFAPWMRALDIAWPGGNGAPAVRVRPA